MSLAPKRDSPLEGRLAKLWQKAGSKVKVRLALAKVFHLENVDTLKHKFHSSYLDKLKKGVIVRAITSRMHENTKIHHATLHAMHAMKSGKSIVATETGGGSSPAFWQQGDAELSTEANFKRRFKLRRAPKVIDALDAFWKSAVAGSGVAGKIDEDGHITKEGHRQLYMRIYKVMLEEWDPEATEADESIEEDWEKDAQGGDSLSRELFFDSLFELADTWTPSIDEQEYADFLWNLFRLLTAGSTDGTWGSLERLTFDESFADDPPDAVAVEKPPLGLPPSLVVDVEDVDDGRSTPTPVLDVEQVMRIEELEQSREAREMTPEELGELDGLKTLLVTREAKMPIKAVARQSSKKAPKQQKKLKAKERRSAIVRIQAESRAKKAKQEKVKKEEALQTINKHVRGRLARKQVAAIKLESLMEAIDVALDVAMPEMAKPRLSPVLWRAPSPKPKVPDLSLALKWKVVRTKPGGREITNAGLVEALRERTEFELEEVQAFGIKPARPNDYVKLTPELGAPFVLVNAIGMSIPVPAKPSDTLASLRSKIAMLTGLQLRNMDLSSDGELLEDETVTLEEASVSNGSAVSVTHAGVLPVEPFMVRVELPPSLREAHGKSLSVPLPPIALPETGMGGSKNLRLRQIAASQATSASVRDLKGVIEAVVHVKAYAQELTFRSKVLRDTQSIMNCRVTFGDTIFLTAIGAVDKDAGAIYMAPIGPNGSSDDAAVSEDDTGEDTFDDAEADDGRWLDPDISHDDRFASGHKDASPDGIVYAAPSTVPPVPASSRPSSVPGLRPSTVLDGSPRKPLGNVYWRRTKEHSRTGLYPSYTRKRSNKVLPNLRKSSKSGLLNASPPSTPRSQQQVSPRVSTFAFYGVQMPKPDPLYPQRPQTHDGRMSPRGFKGRAMPPSLPPWIIDPLQYEDRPQTPLAPPLHVQRPQSHHGVMSPRDLTERGRNTVSSQSVNVTHPSSEHPYQQWPSRPTSRQTPRQMQRYIPGQVSPDPVRIRARSVAVREEL